MRPALALVLLAALAGPVRAQETASPPAAEEVELVPVPAQPRAETTDPNSRTGESLAEPREGSGIPKALRSTGQRAGGPANDLNPGGAPEAPMPPKGELGAVAAGRALYHGNYSISGILG